MDVAHRLAHFRQMPPEQWLTGANRYLPPIVTAILVVVIAQRLAALTWALVPGEPLAGPVPEVAVSAAPRTAAGGAGASLDALRQSHLFGAAPAESAQPAVVEEIVDAPDTTLNLVLHGVQARSDGEDIGEAIIGSGRNQQKIYYVGDTIEGTNGAKLHAIYGDRVILNRSGRFETLRLPQETTGNPAVTSMGQTRMPSQPLGPGPPPDAGSLRQVIGDNASRITDVIRLAPHLEQGEMVGFRINPGRDRDTFSALGFEAGDVVTDVNGMVVNDPQGGLRVFEALGETSMANITILRNGAPQVIVVDTTQLQALAEDLQ